MNEPYIDYPQFSKKTIFAGVFRSGGLATPPLSIEIQYSPINAHPPRGTIHGTSTEYERLEQFFMQKTETLCHLESISSAAGREHIACKGVLIRSISEKRYPDDESALIQQTIGRFEINELQIERDIPIQQKQSATFSLDGPTRLWMSNASRSLSYTGNVTTKVRGGNLMISSLPTLTIQAKPCFHYVSQNDNQFEESGGNPHRDSQCRRSLAETEIFTLTISQPDILQELPDFRELASKVSERLCLLVSFLSKSHVRCFSKTFVSADKLIEVYSSISRRRIDEPSWDDIILHPDDIQTFIEIAFDAHGMQSTNGVDVRLPVVLYVHAQTAPFVEDEFISLFRSLEMLADTLDIYAKAQPLISDDELARIQKILKTELKRIGKSEDERKVIYEKLPELQRAKFSQRLAHHLGRAQVNLDDIGGLDGLEKAIRIRNQLIHSSQEPPIQEMMIEISRLETIVERLMLSLLGWAGRTTTPTLDNWRKLAGKFDELSEPDL